MNIYEGCQAGCILVVDGSKAQEEVDMDGFVKLTTGFADDMLSFGGWMLKKLEAHGTLHNPKDVLGLQAEVSVGIKPGSTGEILVVQAKKLHHYAAQSRETEAQFPRGAKVKIVDVGAGVMFVANYEEAQTTHAEAVTIKDESTDTTHGAAAGSETVDAEQVEAETIDADA